MIEHSPILVTGCPRSGASMIAGIFNICGAFGGNMAVNKSNERGMFENIRIRDTVVKLYLASHGFDPEGQSEIPTSVNDIPTNWKNDVENIMIKEGYKEGSWMYKDSRSTLLWSIWHQTYPNAKWVIVRRRTGDVVESCIKTDFMKAFKTPTSTFSLERDGWLWLVHEYEKRLADMIVAGVDYKIIWPERMKNGDYRQLYEILDWLELKWTVEALTFIDTLLWGGKPRKEVLNGSTNNRG